MRPPASRHSIIRAAASAAARSRSATARLIAATERSACWCMKSTGSIRICPDRGWAAQGSVEGVGKPLGGLPVTVADDGDHVEAAGRQVAAPAHGEVVLCRAADPAALAVVDGLGGVTELDAATQAYLDEHEHGVVAHDQVDLARARGIVGLDQLEPLALEVSAGMALGPGAVGEVARGHRSCPVRPAR